MLLTLLMLVGPNNSFNSVRLEKKQNAVVVVVVLLLLILLIDPSNIVNRFRL